MKKTLILTLLLIACASRTFAQDAESYYADGYKASQAGDFKTAIEKFTKAIELNPKDREYYYARGYVYNQNGYFQDAVDDYSKAISLNPKNIKAIYARASALQDMGEFDKATADYEELIKQKPSEQKTYINNLGIIAHQKGDYEKAIKYFDQAIQLDPNYIRPYYNRALSHSLMGKYAQANVDNAKVLEMDPKNAEAMNNRGINYNKLGDYENALADFNKAIELYPIEKNRGHTPPYLGRAEANFRLGKMDLGFADCEKLISLYPNYPAPYAVRSLGHQLKKEYDQAWDDARHSLSLGGSLPLDQLKSLRKETGLEPYDEELLAFGIKFIPPEGWSKTKLFNREGGVIFNFLNPEKNAVISLVPPIAVGEFEHWINSAFAGLTAESKEQSTFLGLPCEVLTYKEKHENEMVETKVYIINKDGSTYFLSAAVRNANFGDFASVFEKAIKQYELIEKNRDGAQLIK